MSTVRLAVDVNSGDHGTGVLLEGLLMARKRCDIPFESHLCGERRVIEPLLDGSGCDSSALGMIIEDCPQVIEPGMSPSVVWKTMKLSSVVRCISLQKEGAVDASLSAGDTGVMMGASIFLLGRSAGVSRPALAAFLPTVGPRPVLLLDVGANPLCRAEHLAAFGNLGYDYYRENFNVDCPGVALLNIGHEPSKGTSVTAQASSLLEKTCAGYKGYVEGGRVLAGDADVVVCDGFSGNVLLKACESFYSLTESVLSKDAGLLGALRKRMTILNSENYGAAPFLGIKGVVFKAHGSSSAGAFANALTAAVIAAERRIRAAETEFN